MTHATLYTTLPLVNGNSTRTLGLADSFIVPGYGAQLATPVLTLPAGAGPEGLPQVGRG